jgi:hypothetical protein
MRWQWAVVALLAGVAQAQIQEHGLLAGYVLDSRTGTLRRVSGIPGAARLSDPIAFDQVIAEASVRNGRALVISAEESPRVSLLRNLDAPAPEVIPIDSPLAPVSRVFLNASATTALLYSSVNESSQFVTGLDGTPKLSDPIPSSALVGRFLDAAVAETRSCALLTSFDDEHGYLHHVCADSVAQVAVIARLPGVRPAAVAWFDRDRDALIADAAGNELLLLPQFSTGTAPVTLAGPNDGIDNPAALLPLNSTAVAVMNRGSASLVLVDARQTGVTRRIELPEIPTRLETLGASGALACTRTGPGPLLLVDPRRDFAALYVPMN